jgi:hypothetical protein
MKRYVLYIILYLAIPAISHGSTGPVSGANSPDLLTVGWDSYRLEYESMWEETVSNPGSFTFIPAQGNWISANRSLREVSGGIPLKNRPAPRDMASMMSFVWAEMFGGVDIVAEVKDFARQVRRRGRPEKLSRDQKCDLRKQWRFVVACRIDEHAEVAASYKTRGEPFVDGDMSLEINALDPMSEEMGLKMAFAGGAIDIRADRMTLTQAAEARLELKF